MKQLKQLHAEIEALKNQAMQDYIDALEKNKAGHDLYAAYNMAYGIVLMKIDSLINRSK